MLYIMEALPPEVNEKLNIVAIFNPDEEIGSIYSADLIDSYAKISDRAFVYEAISKDGTHTVNRKGIYKSTVSFHGREGHAGYIFDGASISAINELIYWATEINSHCCKERETSVNIGRIEGGKKHNVVPDFAQMVFESRFVNSGEYERLCETLARLKPSLSLISLLVFLVLLIQIFLFHIVLCVDMLLA